MIAAAVQRKRLERLQFSGVAVASLGLTSATSAMAADAHPVRHAPILETLTLEQRFLACVETVTQLNSTPTSEEQLELYALFKQSTVGDNTTPRPTSLFDLARRARWDAWTRQSGKTQNQAMQDYISFAEGLIDTYGIH
ncbi:acyl-CoA-binding protein [Allocatelliglobosispora scoriae]|uniref:Acyl-CoA-binding protein n=1 Tax=Allocatelliglobosispora scoriae TaxID=643052 RepID=A0A841BJ32_9ACTN|nr:acyl-CoA-binding protein [Allocatelliglobosispora scoriae]MBB5867338.1 acyl-CoA-binding protein [Allocatelliglobosispora scoriae]